VLVLHPRLFLRRMICTALLACVLLRQIPLIVSFRALFRRALTVN
jgi:hypothetical protein